MKTWKSYTNSDRILKYMGFQSYEAYLASDLWKGIRQIALERSNFQCKVCRSSNFLQVHHQNYSVPVLRGVKTKGLVVLCRRCHHETEFKKGQKRTMAETQQTLKSKTKRANRRQEEIRETKRLLHEGYKTGALLPDKIPFRF